MLFIGLAAFYEATQAFSSRRAPNPAAEETLRLGGRVVHLEFPHHPLMRAVVADSWPQQLPARFWPVSVSIAPASGLTLQSADVVTIVSQLVGTAFLKYYERNKQRPTAAYGTQPKAWPPLWRFAWLLRNAIAHGDRWAISDPSFPATDWHGVSVTSADSGQAWFDAQRYIVGADVVLLLEELDADAAARSSR